MRIRRIACAAAIFSLAACQSTSGGCPPLVTYSATTQSAAAREMAAGAAPALAKMVTDYGKMRDACRRAR